MDSIEVEAKTVAEAIAIACEKLKTGKENISVKILQEPPNKIFSFVTGRKARIRATRIAPEQPLVPPARSSAGENGTETAGRLQEFLETVVRYINPEASVAVRADDEGLVLNIIGDGSGIFIGKKGQTLEALQYLINKVKVRYCDESFPVTVDSESYRARHSESLATLAVKLGMKAKKRRGPVTTNLLNPAERRIIHLTLKKDNELTTWSKGDGILKKVIIAPRQAAK